MKKWVLIGLFIALILLISVYVLIPRQAQFSYQVAAGCTEKAAKRFVSNKDLLSKWWPGKQLTDDVLSYQESEIKIEKIFLKGFECFTSNDGFTSKGLFHIIYSSDTTVSFLWTGNIFFSNLPWKRVTEYYNYHQMKTTVKNLMNDIKAFFDQQKNIYGFNVEKQKVKDSSLIVTRRNLTHYPYTGEIYEMINSLKNYIISKSGKEVGYPMLNVNVQDSATYRIMVAIPVEKDLPSEGNFEMRRMILGNILSAEVKGGIYIIRKGEEELYNYVNDYNKESPAIPFQSLITNRQMETDTSKWITRLYYPIF